MVHRVFLAAALFTLVPLFAQTGQVRIRVGDPTGWVIRDAEASLLAPDNKPLRTKHANDDGEILFTDLPEGELRFEVRSPGFTMQRLTVVSGPDESQLEVRLMVGQGGGPSSVTPMPSTPAGTPALTTPMRSKHHHRWIFR